MYCFLKSFSASLIPWRKVEKRKNNNNVVQEVTICNSSREKITYCKKNIVRNTL